MKERGILFSGAMVRALLAGTKTQTRRVCRDQPSWTDVSPAWLARCPYGAPGDQLWVRETWRSDVHQRVAYRADGWCGARWPDPDSDERRWFGLQHGWLLGYSKRDGAYYGEKAYGDRWRSSLHMPRWASRITLEVTAVRVQRLQDISEEDARAEGVAPVPGLTFRPEGETELRPLTHREAFECLWDSINGDRAPWSANPWVWAVSFKRVQP